MYCWTFSKSSLMWYFHQDYLIFEGTFNIQIKPWLQSLHASQFWEDSINGQRCFQMYCWVFFKVLFDMIFSPRLNIQINLNFKVYMLQNSEKTLLKDTDAFKCIFESFSKSSLMWVMHSLKNFFFVSHSGKIGPLGTSIYCQMYRVNSWHRLFYVTLDERHDLNEQQMIFTFWEDIIRGLILSIV